MQENTIAELSEEKEEDGAGKKASQEENESGGQNEKVKSLERERQQQK